MLCRNAGAIAAMIHATGDNRTSFGLLSQNTKAPSVRSHMPRLRSDAPWFLAYFAGYCGLLVFFKWVDVYHTQFAARGAIVVGYNAARVAFTFYLFWIIAAPGRLLLRWIAAERIDAVTLPEALVLSFFAGAGLWHLGMLALGFINLYTVPVAVALTLPAVGLSFPAVRATLNAAGKRAHCLTHLGPPERIGIGLALLLGALLLLLKGLYPAGSADYFAHYFPYYREVIERGGVWPNDVWYHYFYSKGLGLFFLGMLLTDPLAPQLVTFCCMAAAALVLFVAVRDIAPGTNWPMATVLLFLGLYVFTPGWAEFEKQHELNTALVVAVLWMTHRALGAKPSDVLMFGAVAALAIMAAVIANVLIAVFFGAIFSLFALILMVRRRFRNGLICAALASWSGALVVFNFALNYVTVGLPSDLGIPYAWSIADVEKLYQWGSLPIVLIFYWGRKAAVAAAVPLVSPDSYKLLVQSLRLDLLYPLTLGAFALVCASTWWRARRRELQPNAAALRLCALLATALIVCIAVALTAGRTQVSSFHRYTSFIVPLVILFSVALWIAMAPALNKTFLWIADTRWTPLAVAVSCLIVTVLDTHLPRHLMVPRDAIDFAIGRASIDEAYTRLGRWPSYYVSWGGIYNGARSAYAIVGPKNPIWSFAVDSFCMLPDCEVKSFMSFNMTSKWDRIMLGSPEEAEQLLKSSGINHFLYSSELYMSDPSPLSALFAPANIAAHLGLIWTDGTSSLLTWRGPGTQPLDEAWLAAYRQTVTESPTVQSFPLEAFRKIYERYYAMPHPWRPIALPW
jgi:hypothetical protein